MRRQCETVRERLLALALPEALVAELSARLPALLSRGPVAVRSSSTLEDLAGAAFAGQHDTFLNRSTLESVLDAVRRCFASLWEDRAVRYRAERGYRQQERPRWPSSSSRWSRASPRASPSRCTRSPATRTGSSSTARGGSAKRSSRAKAAWTSSSSIARRAASSRAEVAEKERAIVSAEDGTRAVALPEGRAKARSLSDAELSELWRLAIAVERNAGFPQDIEWATSGGRMYLLQSRPITTLPDRWTRDESAERFPNAVTPLSWDYAGAAFHTSLAHSLRLMGMPPFAGLWFERFDGYIYGNQTAVRLFTIGFPPFQSLDELRRLLPHVRERYPWIERLPASWTRDLDRYLLRLGELAAVDPGRLGEPELGALIAAIGKAGEDYFLPNIAISLTHALLHRSLYTFLRLVAEPTEAARLYDELMGYCETKTSLVNADLQELARAARADPALERRLRETDKRALWEKKGLSAFPSFEAAFTRFLENHGHREVDFDAFHPTWSGQPWIVLENVRLLLDQPLPDPAIRSSELRQTQQAAEADLSERVPEDLRFFAAELVRLCRTYTSLDDVEHYQTTRLNAPFRRAIIALGARLARRGVLESPEDVFFLRRQTLEEPRRGPRRRSRRARRSPAGRRGLSAAVAGIAALGPRGRGRRRRDRLAAGSPRLAGNGGGSRVPRPDGRRLFALSVRRRARRENDQSVLDAPLLQRVRDRDRERRTPLPRRRHGPRGRHPGRDGGQRRPRSPSRRHSRPRQWNRRLRRAPPGGLNGPEMTAPRRSPEAVWPFPRGPTEIKRGGLKG